MTGGIPMVKKCCETFCVAVVVLLLMTGCSSRKPAESKPSTGLQTNRGDITETDISRPSDTYEADETMRENREEPTDFQSAGTDTEPIDPADYTHRADNFLILLDVSASKYLPYSKEIKLKTAKDIVRRMIPYIPSRPLVGGLRRLGFEAGAWTDNTAILYGMTPYTAGGLSRALEQIRWAGGKSFMGKALERSGADMAGTVGNIALIIISDGIVKRIDPVPFAKRLKEQYGDRLCIYTVLIGDSPFGDRLLKELVKAGKCGFPVTADSIVPEESMADWVDDVFSGRRRAPAPRVAKAPRFVDTDGDGVPDHLDKCAGTPKGATVNDAGCWLLETVYFDLNEWKIKPKYRSVLNEVARVLKNNPDVVLGVQGHTCNIWTEDYNEKLSRWRAEAVAKYLRNQGVNSSQLVTKGFGMDRPEASNKTVEGRERNRRVEFIRLQ